MAKNKGSRSENGTGYTYKDNKGKWHCIIQTNFVNPKTLKIKKFHRTGDSEEEARENTSNARDAWEKALMKNEEVVFKKSTLFGECMKAYVDTIKGISGSTYLSYSRALERYFYTNIISMTQIGSLDEESFQLFYDYMLDNYARATLRTPMQMCRRCCQWLVDKSYLKENYAMKATPRKDKQDEYDKKKADMLKNRKEVFTTDDIKKFYAAFKNHQTEYAVVAIFLLETGIRASEFAALTNDCIDFEKKIIYIDKARSKRYIDKNNKELGTETYIKVPKNSKIRPLPITPLVEECLIEMQTQTKLRCVNGNPNDLLYPTFRTGEARSNSTMEVGFKLLCDKLGIDRDPRRDAHGHLQGLCLHSLRHTMISYANNYTGNSILTSIIAGHQQGVDEKIYTHTNEELIKNFKSISQTVLKQETAVATEGDNDTITEEQEKMLLKLLLNKYKDKLDTL